MQREGKYPVSSPAPAPGLGVEPAADVRRPHARSQLPPGVSTILGVEFSGTIEETQGDKFKKGDEV